MSTEISQPARPWYLGLLILLMVPLPGMGIDLYTPSLPALVINLHTSMHLVKLTIGIYLAGYCIGPLLFGSLSDRYGRKKILLAGLISYIVSILIILLWQNIIVLLLMRFAQGFTAAAIAATFRAMITDSYRPGKEMHKISSMMSTVWAIGPVVAPFIGGYLQHYFGWQANFMFFIVYALIIFACFPFIPETNNHKIKLKPAILLEQYKTILTHKVFWYGIICMGVAYSLIAIFNVVSPFFIQGILHFTPIQYGHVALVMGFAFLFGGLLNAYLIHKLPATLLVLVTLMLMLVSSSIIILLGIYATPNLYRLVIPVFLVLFFSAAIFPAGAAKCLGLFPKMAGAAGAVMGCLFVTMTALATVVASFLVSSTQTALGIAYLVLVIFCLLSYIVLNKK